MGNCCGRETFSAAVKKKINPILDKYSKSRKEKVEKIRRKLYKDLEEKEITMAGYKYIYSEEDVQKTVEQYGKIISKEINVEKVMDDLDVADEKIKETDDNKEEKDDKKSQVKSEVKSEVKSHKSRSTKKSKVNN